MVGREKLLVLETSKGDIELELMPEHAPKACENFVTHVKNGYYDGVIFHRIIKGFMIQGGDPSGTGIYGESIWGEPFDDEVNADLSFDRPGLLAMANKGPSTNGSQFFITTASTPWLDMRHTIFGSVVDGYDIVEKLEGVEVDAEDRPVEEEKILRAYVKCHQKKSVKN